MRLSEVSEASEGSEPKEGSEASVESAARKDEDRKEEQDGGEGGQGTCASMTKRSLPTALRTSQEPWGMAGIKVSLLLRKASSSVCMNSCSRVPSLRHALPLGIAK